MRFSVMSAGVLAAAALISVPATANAATFTLGTCLTGDCGSVTGSVLVSITDSTTDPGSVDFQIDNNSNGDLDYLNFSYSSVAGSAVITDFTTSGTTGAPAGSFNGGTDASLAYDVKVDFPNPAAMRFGAGESVAFTLASSTGFDFDASGFSPVLAHVIALSIGGQSVKLGEGGGGNTGGGGSTGGGGQTIPEPASLALFGLAALALGRRRSR